MYEFFPGLGAVTRIFKDEEYVKEVEYDASFDNSCFEFSIY